MFLLLRYQCLFICYISMKLVCFLPVVLVFFISLFLCYCMVLLVDFFTFFLVIFYKSRFYSFMPIKTTFITFCSGLIMLTTFVHQELQYLELKSEQDPEDIQQWVTTGSTAPVTPFSVLAAEKSSTAVEKLENATHVQFGTSADVAVRKVSNNVVTS